MAESSTAVRFGIVKQEFPAQIEALIYTDLLRQASLSNLQANPIARHRTLLGGRECDDRAMSGHNHAHFLPICNDEKLVELAVWIPEGLPLKELWALASVHRLSSGRERVRRLDVRMSGYGRIERIAPELVGPARVWRSATPFVPARYPKRQQEGARFFEDEIARELGYRGHPTPHVVEQITDRDWREFVRYRPSRRSSSDKRQGQANRAACFLELTFSEPVKGPISLGHLSHFGLGLFLPVN